MSKFWSIAGIAALSLTPVAGAVVITATAQSINEIIYNEALDYFKQMCKIPHITMDVGHEDSLDAIKQFVLENTRKFSNIENVNMDAAGNIWYDILPSEGCENYKPIILQGHLDMVWAAQGEATQWDKWTHPVAEPVVEVIKGEHIMHSKNYLTNLGVDNGNAVALMLSLSKYNSAFTHGRIRCIYTVNEEGSPYPGAGALGVMEDGTTIKVINHDEGYDYLLNLDGNPIGDVVFNSAGITKSTWEDYDFSKAIQDNSQQAYKITITGCHGGHSGINIINKYANPIKLLFEGIASNCTSFKLSSIHTVADSKTSIPTEASIEAVINSSEIEKIEKWFDEVKKEERFSEEDPNKFKIYIATSGARKVLDEEFSQKISEFVNAIDNGPILFYEEEEENHAVKLSANIGNLSYNDNPEKPYHFTVTYASRFQENNVEDIAIEKYGELVKALSEYVMKRCGSQTPVITPGHEAAWEGNKQGKMCQLCSQAYSQLNVKPTMKRIHGVLECYEFIEMNEYLDQVSIGPTNDAEHGVQENLHLETYMKIVETVLYMAERMNF